MSDHETPKVLNVWPGIVASAVVAAAMLAASAWAWDRIPDRVPVHFGIDGMPDRYGSKWEALFIMPGVVALIGLIMAVVPLIDPRRNNLAQSSGFYYAVWYGELAVMSVAHAGMIAAAMGATANVGQALFVAVGLLFIVMGNYMSKSRPNWFAGFRTPWTLSSDYSWQKTHRMTGWMFMAAGAATILAGIFVSTTAAALTLIGGALLAAAIGTWMSYVYWKNDPEKRVN
jgi:uncharacterized membrane protein